MLGLGSLRAGQSKAARIFLDLAKNLPEAPEATTWNSTYLEALESLEGGDPEAAANALTRLHGLVPQRDTVDEAYLMVLELTILMLQGRKADALSLSSQSVSRGLEHPDLCFLRGELQLQNGDLKEAALAFQACLSLDPTHTAAAERLASLT